MYRTSQTITPARYAADSLSDIALWLLMHSFRFVPFSDYFHSSLYLSLPTILCLLLFFFYLVNVSYGLWHHDFITLRSVSVPFWCMFIFWCSLWSGCLDYFCFCQWSIWNIYRMFLRIGICHVVEILLALCRLFGFECIVWAYYTSGRLQGSAWLFQSPLNDTCRFAASVLSWGCGWAVDSRSLAQISWLFLCWGVSSWWCTLVFWGS